MLVLLECCCSRSVEWSGVRVCYLSFEPCVGSGMRVLYFCLKEVKTSHQQRGGAGELKCANFAIHPVEFLWPRPTEKVHPSIVFLLFFFCVPWVFSALVSIRRRMASRRHRRPPTNARPHLPVHRRRTTLYPQSRHQHLIPVFKYFPMERMRII